MDGLDAVSGCDESHGGRGGNVGDGEEDVKDDEKDDEDDGEDDEQTRGTKSGDDGRD